MDTSALSLNVTMAMCRPSTSPGVALTDQDRLECWAYASTPRAYCTTGAGCNYAYAWSKTPEVCSVSPQYLFSSGSITLAGPTSAISTHTGTFPATPTVLFGVNGTACASVASNTGNAVGNLTCSTPAGLLAGVYSMALTDGAAVYSAPAGIYGSSCGAYSPSIGPSFVYGSTVTASLSTAGSGGGVPLTVAVTAGGALSTAAGVVGVYLKLASTGAAVQCPTQAVNASAITCLVRPSYVFCFCACRLLSSAVQRARSASTRPGRAPGLQP